VIRACFVSLILLVFHSGFAQKKSFDIVLLGNVIGETNVVKTDDGAGKCNYRLKSVSRAKVLFTQRSSDMEFDATYLSGKLYTSLCRVVTNGALAITEIVKDAQGYLIKKEAEILHVTQPITFSSMELYFSEPVNQKSVFSERMGVFSMFAKTAPGEYTNKTNDVTNIYRYRDGALYEVEMRKPLGSVYLRAKK
jgi:hypothetical protein